MQTFHTTDYTSFLRIISPDNMNDHMKLLHRCKDPLLIPDCPLNDGGVHCLPVVAPRLGCSSPWLFLPGLRRALLPFGLSDGSRSPLLSPSSHDTQSTSASWRATVPCSMGFSSSVRSALVVLSVRGRNSVARRCLGPRPVFITRHPLDCCRWCGEAEQGKGRRGDQLGWWSAPRQALRGALQARAAVVPRICPPRALLTPALSRTNDHLSSKHFFRLPAFAISTTACLASWSCSSTLRPAPVLISVEARRTPSEKPPFNAAVAAMCLVHQ